MSLTADLSGERALITGASSAGFGAHFARVLSSAGPSPRESLDSTLAVVRGAERQLRVELVT